MTDNAMTIEDMKAELEANGYRLYAHPRYGLEEVVTPDGWVIRHESKLPKWFINKAYAHLQQQRELEDLRAFVLATKASLSKKIDKNTYGSSMYIMVQARELIEKYNITEDESADDE